MDSNCCLIVILNSFCMHSAYKLQVAIPDTVYRTSCVYYSCNANPYNLEFSGVIFSPAKLH